MLLPVLYTHQKLKKTKVWKDGKIKITQPSQVSQEENKRQPSRVSLMDEQGKVLESAFLSPPSHEGWKAGDELELDHHLIQIEESLPVDTHLSQSLTTSLKPLCTGSAVLKTNLKRRRFVPPLIKDCAQLSNTSATTFANISILPETNVEESYKKSDTNSNSSPQHGPRSNAYLLKMLKRKSSDNTQMKGDSNSENIKSPEASGTREICPALFNPINGAHAATKPTKMVHSLAQRAVTSVRRNRVRQNNVVYGPNSIRKLYFPLLSEQNLKIPRRKEKLPSTFADEESYFRTLQNCLLDCLQISICESAKVAKRICENGKIKEKSFLQNPVLYEPHAQIKLLEYNDRFLGEYRKISIEVAPSFATSNYKKDDLYMVSTDINSDKDVVFLRTLWHGVLNMSIEVALFDEQDLEKLKNLVHQQDECSKTLTVIRLLNISSEWLMIEQIRSFSLLMEKKRQLLLEKFPLLPWLLNRSNHSSAGSQVDFFTKDEVTAGFNICRQTAKEYHLNDDQTRILENFINSVNPSSNNPITLCHGVFGSGKSYLVSVLIILLHRLCNAFNNDKIKILVSSNTNVAVDRILCNLLDLGFTDFVRVGSLRKISKRILPYTLQMRNGSEEIKELQRILKEEELEDAESSEVQRTIQLFKEDKNLNLLGSTFVTGTTCISSMTGIYKRDQSSNFLSFPITILDECSQMTETTSLLPLASFGCQKCLLIGDPKQLPPTLPSADVGITGLELTLFERLSSNIKPLQLRTQYRCQKEIAEIANSLFYDNMLINGSKYSENLLSAIPIVSFFNIKLGNETFRNKSMENELESNTITKAVTHVLNFLEPENIGVISFYRQQVSQIAKNLNETNIRSVFVSTIDAFQGGERDVILLSTVRSNSRENVGFLDDKRRINVALTRAKRHLMIFGNRETLKKSSIWSSILQKCTNMDDLKPIF